MFLSARQGSRPGDTAIDNKKKKKLSSQNL